MLETDFVVLQSYVNYENGYRIKGVWKKSTKNPPRYGMAPDSIGTRFLHRRFHNFLDAITAFIINCS